MNIGWKIFTNHRILSSFLLNTMSWLQWDLGCSWKAPKKIITSCQNLIFESFFRYLRQSKAHEMKIHLCLLCNSSSGVIPAVLFYYFLSSDSCCLRWERSQSWSKQNDNKHTERKYLICVCVVHLCWKVCVFFSPLVFLPQLRHFTVRLLFVYRTYEWMSVSYISPISSSCKYPFVRV